MVWIALAILIIAGWIIYSKKKNTVTITKDQAKLVLDMVAKEKKEIASEIHDVVDKGALEGKTLPVESVSKYTEGMTEEQKRYVDEFKQELIEQYGPTLPINTAHRLAKHLDGDGQMWSEKPGCFERHLQRRDGNLLFPPERRIVTYKEIEEAKEKDRAERQVFEKKATLFIDNFRQQGNVPLNQAWSSLKELQELIEEASSIGGGNIEPLIIILEGVEKALMDSIGSTSAELPDLLNRAQNQSILARLPYMAQISRKDSPILPEDETPALLSEDLSTISIQGYSSRAFSEAGSDYHPNEADIRSHLDKAVNQGFSKERANRIINAWNERGHETSKDKE